MSPLVTINGLENTGEQEQANENNEKINCKKLKEKILLFASLQYMHKTTRK